MPLNSDLITSRRSAYLCCAAEAGVAAVRASIVGDAKCYDNYMRMAAWYTWGASVMARYHIESDGEPCCQDKPQCVTEEFALQTIAKIDALDGCIRCGCDGPDDRPIDCSITPDYTVLSVVDAGFQPSALAGMPYLIVGNLNGWAGTWASHLSDIVTDTTFITPQVGEITLDMSNSLGSYWVMTSIGQGQFFPRFDGTLNGTQLTLLSLYQNVNDLLQRDVLVEVSTDATNWTPIYVGNEADAQGIYDNIDPLTLYTRVTYLYGEEDYCQSEALIGHIPPQSPERLSVQIGYDGAVGQQGQLTTGSALPTNITDLWAVPKFTLAFYTRITAGAGFPFFAYVRNPSNANVMDIYSDGTSLTLSGPGVTVAGAMSLLDDTWHHVAIVRDVDIADVRDWSTGVTMYLDGVPVIMGTQTGTFVGSMAAQHFINFGTPGAASPLSGYIRMCEIYLCNTARSQADIQNFLMTGTAFGNDALWDRTLYIVPVPSDTDTNYATNGGQYIVSGLPVFYGGTPPVQLFADNPL